MKSFKNKYVKIPNRKREKWVVTKLVKSGYELCTVTKKVSHFIELTNHYDYPIHLVVDEYGVIKAYFNKNALPEVYKKVSIEEFFSTEWGEDKTVEVRKENNGYTSVSFTEFDRTVEVRYNKVPMTTKMFANSIIDLIKGSGFHEPDVFQDLQFLIEEEELG